MELIRRVTEGLARKTSRRGLFGRGAEIATGALLGVAAGTLTRAGSASAGHGVLTVCGFPGPGCPCGGCTSTGPCAKPCLMNTTWYASGCWVTGSVTCCDCDCQGMLNDIQDNHGRAIGDPINTCGCGSDYHNNPALCP